MNVAKSGVRAVGEISNLFLAAAFITATLLFYDRTIAFIAAGGGFVRVADLGIGWIAQQASRPDITYKAVHWIGAWLCGIATLGCAWMSVLGLRWSYHAFLRLIKA